MHIPMTKKRMRVRDISDSLASSRDSSRIHADAMEYGHKAAICKSCL